MSSFLSRAARRASVRARSAAAIGIIALAAAATVATSGAWFTAAATAPAVVNGATLSIGEIGRTGDDATVQVADAFPMTEAQAGLGGAASQWVTIRNTGSIPLSWTVGAISPRALAPLDGTDLGNFRFRLVDGSGAPLTSAAGFDGLPSGGDGSLLATGPVLEAGQQTRIALEVWLTPESPDRFQGSVVELGIVVNGMQAGSPRAARLDAVQLSAAPGGDPTGSTSLLSWTPASSPDLTIAPGDATYTLERATTSDFADAQRVYSGPDLAFEDSTGASVGRVTALSTSSNGSGGGSTYAVAGGSVYGWGSLVTGGTASVPTLIAGFPSDVEQIAAGSRHLCAITVSDRLFCAGSASAGQLGDGRAGAFAASAVELPATGALSGADLTSIAASANSTCVVLDARDIACWGSNASLELGLWETRPTYRATPTLLRSSGEPYTALAGRIDSVVGGAKNFCAVTDSGVHCWGSSAFGQLSGSSTTRPNYSAAMNAPQLFAGTSGAGGAVAIGWEAICAVVDSGALRCTGHFNHGSHGDGQVGTGATGGTSLIGGAWSGVSAGQSHVCASSATEKTTKCWGWGAYGQLGTGDTTTANATPREVEALRGTEISALTAGYDTTCALTATGEVRCFGNNARGAAIGSSAPALVTTPTVPSGSASLGCAARAVASTGSCSLEPGRTYYYRLTYTVADAAVGSSPAADAVRAGAR